MVVVPDTIRVRKQGGRDRYGNVIYLDEFEDVGAAHFRMDEERFKEALIDVYKDWITVIKVPAAFRARLTVEPAGGQVVRTATGRRLAARRRRVKAMEDWFEQRCVVDHDVESYTSELVADCRKWHEEREFELPPHQRVGRVVQQHAVGTQRTVAGNVTLGVALKGA